VGEVWPELETCDVAIGCRPLDNNNAGMRRTGDSNNRMDCFLVGDLKDDWELEERATRMIGLALRLGGVCMGREW
jgi:hypothetical protein